MRVGAATGMARGGAEGAPAVVAFLPRLPRLPPLVQRVWAGLGMSVVDIMLGGEGSGGEEL